MTLISDTAKLKQGNTNDKPIFRSIMIFHQSENLMEIYCFQSSMGMGGGELSTYVAGIFWQIYYKQSSPREIVTCLTLLSWGV